MTRHVGTAVALASLLAAACGPAPERPPDVVLISVDTLRQDFLGVTGDPDGTSPVLDRLARQGALAENAWSTSSWTLPAHMSLFTGQYPASHGVWTDGRSLPGGKRTIAQVLSDRGYRTAGFWCGPYLHPAYGFARGFDTYEACVSYPIHLDENGAIRNAEMASLLSRSGVTAPKLDAAAEAWLDTVSPDEPFFLFLHYWDPHADYEPPPPYDRFLDPEYDGKISGHGVLQDRRIHPGMPEEDRRHLMDLYRGEIRWTDAWIGKIVRRLEERGSLDRTLIVVVSDHGEEFFEHGARGHRQNLYETTVRVPVILRLPGEFAGGRILRRLVSLVDVLPTIAAATGAPVPARAQGVDLGVSPPPDPGRQVFASLENRIEAVRDAEWKAIRATDGGGEELYRLDRDPGERDNLREQDGAAWARELKALAQSDRGKWAPDSLATPDLDAGTRAELRALGYTD